MLQLPQRCHPANPAFNSSAPCVQLPCGVCCLPAHFVSCCPWRSTVWQFIRLVHKLEDLLNQPWSFPSPYRLISVLWLFSTGIPSLASPSPHAAVLSDWWPTGRGRGLLMAQQSCGERNSVFISQRSSWILSLCIQGERYCPPSSWSPEAGPGCYVVATDQPEWNPNTFIPWICGIYFFINSREAVREVAGLGDNLYE